MLPVERTWMVNPGQALDVGDRVLRALRPPVYDAPETMAVFDARTGHLFSSDCFGAVMQQPAESAAAIGPTALHDGLALWASIDAPWLAQIGRDSLIASCRTLRDLQPRLILASHLPPAAGLDDRLYRGLEAALAMSPFVGPDQAAFERATRAVEPAAV